MVKLVLLRHGQSQANETNTYTGWTDSLLTEEGAKQARDAGKLLKKEKIFFSTVHTSSLVRAIKTANIVLSTIGQAAVPIQKNWRLNERHYGALRGINKDLSRQIYGKHQIALWRRSYDAVPPLMAKPDYERRYNKYPRDILPLGESLKMASERIVPYWLDNIAPQLLHGKNQLIVAHGSTLRALIKYIEEISDEKIDGVEVENAVPIIYELDKKLRVMNKETL
ncbi:2,3-bisphosphoglycerate-dependent phosphoglycerate mutase [Liquorilactobacillus uvarum]|uniref:2,3-bisphosphoglycerate-dependent phosphoglycerate mutase n=1 Tax=Liquorilactobacillus uvarum DSM 19971 TaxID=1423812 RepID=A0A0R1Q8V7_9LACO|nr:2,3-diphosphoglycerate-dependent phosphoglycerate mutase [Liquorilactobacillus uvarum]KRL38938.1 2,3-bisphosphoglycerate-dependent phosphoglycerate mutase [Liquorilactobacillus uvarum DSM 19971]